MVIIIEGKVKAIACVQTLKGHTNFFPIKRGVKQGCNLSPLLFSLYINDLPSMLNPTTILNQSLSCLLFAYDIVLFSDNLHDLQESINSLHSFCTTSFLNTVRDMDNLNFRADVPHRYSEDICTQCPRGSYGKMDKMLDQRYVHTYLVCLK